MLEEAFDAEAVEDFAPRYNLAPTDILPVVIQAGKQRLLKPMTWGFPSAAGLFINARSESVTRKKMFRDAYLQRRCLIAVDAFYEWTQAGKVREPFLFEMPDSRPFALAGIWEQHGGTARCCVLTTDCNDLLRPIHDRMPVILSPANYSRWLDSNSALGSLDGLLKPYPVDAMRMLAVNATNDREMHPPAPDHTQLTLKLQ